MRAAFPVRDAPVRRLVQERSRVERSLAVVPASAAWQMAGPTNIGGRATSVVFHPTVPERIWLGAAGGGVWYSPDAGQSWHPQWHRQDVLNVGSLAIDPVDPNILYCGTGEANLSADSYGGVGLYQTLDGGEHWHLLAASVSAGIPQRIGVVAIDPFDSNHLIVGGIGYAEVSGENADFGGMYDSRDQGVTWRRIPFVAPDVNDWCHSVVFDPVHRGIVYAGVTERGARNGMYKSNDGGATWRQLGKGLPPPERFGRISIAVCASKPEVVYALACDRAPATADRVLGVFRSTDGGERWREIGGVHFADEGQLSYNNTIVVHPSNPNHVLCGGVDLHLTTDAGKHWKRVTEWDRERGDPKYAHADHHHLVMTPSGRVYDPNDGGLDISDDGGRTWVNRSNGLAATMFYDIDAGQAEAQPLFYGGGAQDNGTVVTVDGGSHTFGETLGGDGGWLAIDPLDSRHYFASLYNLGIYRYRGVSPAVNVSPPASTDEQNKIWMCYIVLDPHDAQTVFTGSYRVWRSRDDGDNWTAVSEALDGSNITAIEVAPKNSRRLYVGTENGGVFRSLDGGDTWSANIASAVLPGYTITRLATSPGKEGAVYATSSNFGQAHVFRSRDGGTSWEDIDRGQLPHVPHTSILIVENDGEERLIVGNHAGVYLSEDDGAHWANLTGNLPNVMVVDLAYHGKSKTLFAATYGRSIWQLKL
jgi:photosystem II stability/assembly factor-like uncharacterized protein